MNAYEVQMPKRSDKSFIITGPGDLLLNVDYDDVDRQQVLMDAHELVNVMNYHYTVKELAALKDRIT